MKQAAHAGSLDKARRRAPLRTSVNLARLDSWCSLSSGDYEIVKTQRPAQPIDKSRDGSRLEVHRMAQNASGQMPCLDVDQTALARTKVSPMVTPLSIQSERAVALGVLQKSVVFLMLENITDILHATSI